MPAKKYSFQPVFFTTIGQPQQLLSKQEFKDMLERWIEAHGLIEHHPAQEGWLGDNNNPYVSINNQSGSFSAMYRYLSTLQPRDQINRHRVWATFGMRSGNWQGDFDKHFLNPLFNILKMVEQAPQPVS